MVFLDVTGSCKSPKNTGIQRVVRKIFRELETRTPVTPVSWNEIGATFQLLGKREEKILRTPFAVSAGPEARPDLAGENFWAETQRWFARPRAAMERTMAAGDVLLVPDIFRDRRLAVLPRLLARSDARAVAIFHDAAALRLPELSARGRRRFQNYLRSLAAFDLVIAVSHESETDLQRFWAELKMKPAPACVEGWPMEFDGLVRPHGDGGGHGLLCVGSLEFRKNHLQLLDAAESLWAAGTHFSLTLIGRSTGKFGHHVTRRIRELQRTGRQLHWPGHVNDDELHRAYHDCFFTVYPSLIEGFGLPIIESLWHGKPCVCGGNGSLGEAARGGGCLLVEQSETASLANGLRQLLSDPELHRRLVDEANGRRFRTWSDYVRHLCGHLRIGVCA